MQIHILPVLQDNYAYILRDEDSDLTLVVDPSETFPIKKFLDTRGWKLDGILSTHHHWDHVGGNTELSEIYGCPVFAHSSDAQRTPAANRFVEDGEHLAWGKIECRVLHIPGHTLGQVAFWFPDEEALFVGDTLFGYGCGRLFEGSADMMFQSLQKIKALPPSTQIYCGHEYTARNLQFCIEALNDPLYKTRDVKSHLEKLKSDLQRGTPSMPLSLKEQVEHNPFLRATSAQEFASLRKVRDEY